MGDQKTITRVAVLLLNFNLPDLTDNLVEQIRRNVSFPHELFLLDNGSEADKVTRYATHTVEKNVGMNGGIDYLWDVVKDRDDFDAYWFLCNDIVLDDGRDYLAEMAALFAELSERYRVATITPSYHYEGKRAVPEFMRKRETGSWRAISWLEWNALLVSRQVMSDLFPGGFQLETRHAFQDVVLSYEGWMNGYGSFIMDNLPIEHIENQTFLQHGGKTVNGVLIPDYAGLEEMLVSDMHVVQADYARRGTDLVRMRAIHNRDIDVNGDFEKYLLDGYRPEPEGRLKRAVRSVLRRS